MKVLKVSQAKAVKPNPVCMKNKKQNSVPGRSGSIHTLNFQFHLLMNPLLQILNQSQTHHYLLCHLHHHHSGQSCPTVIGFFVVHTLQFNFKELDLLLTLSLWNDPLNELL